MNDTICLDDRFSTTRRVRKVAPKVVLGEIKAEQRPEDQVETVLFLSEGEGRQGEGGLRTQGYFKQSKPDKPLITVVTVVYNGAQFLEETILSVINQTYDNVEYIVIDGGSTDGTLEIIRKYEHAIDYWASEKDKGIYDAMNKGIDLATGERVNFMNGGDAFYENATIKKIFTLQEYPDFDVIYGNHQVIYPSGRKRFAKAGLIKNIWKGSQFCHQASFVKTEYHKIHKFNLCTKIVADFEFFYNSMKEKKEFRFVDLTVVRFKAGGISDVKRIDSILGWWSLVDKSLKVNVLYLSKIIIEYVKLNIKRIYKWY